MILAIILAAAATVTPGVADSGWISGNTLTTILSILCGAGGIVGGKMWGDRNTKKRVDEVRTKIANELRAKIVNDPLHVSKVQNCVSIDECNRRMCEHTAEIQNLRDEVINGQKEIVSKLDELDQRSENRAIASNQRIDRVMERSAEMRGQVEATKDLVKSAFIGGKK